MKTQWHPSPIAEVRPHSFIFTLEQALMPEICTMIIDRFEANPERQHPGRIGQSADQDASIKKTTDIAASCHKDWQDIDQLLFRSLALALRDIRQKFAYFKGSFKDLGYNIQRYHRGEYFHWHIDGGSHQFSQRQLVAIWYLNDVQGPGGETQFLYQDVKITPQQGKLLLFPPFWTHEHRSVTLDQGVKYIATTWLVFA